MITMNRARCLPFDHQLVGIQALVDNPFFFLADEMGVGKTKQVIDAACTLYLDDVIDRAIVLAPAAVRAVWYDPEFGELKKHLWEQLPADVIEFHARTRQWKWSASESGRGPLQWIITNYEFIGRSRSRLLQLKPYANRRTLLVLDESSAVKGHKSKQTKACVELRKECGRVVLLNGTPIENSPADLFSQANILSPRILECKSYTHFCLRYAVMKPVLGSGGNPLRSPRGFPIQTVDHWTNQEDLQRRFAPYVLRRIKADVLKDLPAKLPSVVLQTPLTPETWKHYVKMRDEMVTWLTKETVVQAPQLITRLMRLAQITNGFVGGVEDVDPRLLEADPDAPEVEAIIESQDGPRPMYRVEEVGREKLDVFLDWLGERLTEDPHFKLLVWCVFRDELQRLVRELKALPAPIVVGAIHGGQSKTERERALSLLHPASAPSMGPVVVVGNPQAGARGLNLTAAHTVFYLSNTYRYGTRLQSEDRVHRPGQTEAVSYYDLIATGPSGQKTIDHRILSVLRSKQDLASMTTNAWREMLLEE